MDRAPRHSAVVDFIQHNERCWVVLEEDHEKVEKENARLRAELDGLTEAAREKEEDYFRIQSEAQNLRAKVEALRKDKDRLDAIEGNCWDVRYGSYAIADTGDSDITIEIIGHFQGAPHERVVGENYNENLRAAIDQAMTADAYPPARPEYDENGQPVAGKSSHP